MAEHRLLAAMEEEVAAKIAAIQRQADAAIREIEATVDQTLAAEQAEAEVRLREQLDEYERATRRQRDREWRSRIRELQFEVVTQAFGDLARGAAEIRARDDYPAVWSCWFAEALAAYRSERGECAEPPILRTAPADRHLADQWATEMGGVELHGALADGLELVSPDRRLRIVNTSASRLQRGRDEFLKMISETFQEQVKS